jgi:N-acetylglucosamine-6-phosphate deacetylase
VSDTYVLGPARLAIGDGSVAEGRIAIERGKIARILPPDGPSDIGLPAEAIVAPGLIDVHTNGADEFLFNRDQGNAVEVAARAYARMGATGFVASIMTAPWESMMHAASEVSEAANQLEESAERIGARCLGIQFEGPFLNPKFRRVHRGEWLLPATIERANEMIEACRGALVMVTMAPEAEGVENVARMFFDQGIVCSAGHTSAHYRDGMLAIGLGFRTLTHAYNGMPPLDHRDPSLLAAFIQEGRTTVQLIADGYHVSPPMVDLTYRTLRERLVLTTDNMPPAGSAAHRPSGAQPHEVRRHPVRDRDRQRHAQPRAPARARARPGYDRTRQARRPFDLERRSPGARDHRRRVHRVRSGASLQAAADSRLTSDGESFSF